MNAVDEFATDSMTFDTADDVIRETDPSSPLSRQRSTEFQPPAAATSPVRGNSRSTHRSNSPTSTSSSDSEADQPEDKHLFPDGIDLNYTCNTSNWFVFKVVNWVLKNCGLVEGPYVWLRMAKAFATVDVGLRTAHVRKAFDASKSLDIMSCYEAVLEMAKVYGEFGEYPKVIATLSPVHDILHGNRHWDPDLDELRDAYGKVVEEILRYLIKAELDEASLEFTQKCLEYAPKNGYFLYHQFRLLCKNNQIEAARIALDQWKSSYEESRYSPGWYISKVLKDENNDDARSSSKSSLTAMFVHARRCELLASLQESVSDALKVAQETQDFDTEVLLQFARGMVFAVERNENATATAVDAWSRFRELYPLSNFEGQDLDKSCQKYLAQVYFDHARMRVSSHSSTEETTQQFFAMTADRIQDVYTNLYFDTHASLKSCRSFAIACLTLAGNGDEVHRHLKEDKTYALELLTDKFDWNDNRGLWTLLRIMLALGDYAACHSVYSLFGRKGADVGLTALSDATGKTNDHVEGSVKTGDDTCSDEENNSSKSSESSESSEHSISDKPESAYVKCCACLDKIFAQGTNEIWMCKYCYEADFCESCYNKLKKDEIDDFLCRFDHEHLLLKHFNYSDEEIMGDNVRIGWKLEQGSDSRDRDRVGEGQIVDRSTWMKMLRKEWNIPSYEEWLEAEYAADPDFGLEMYLAGYGNLL